jgi:hypothetical protein
MTHDINNIPCSNASSFPAQALVQCSVVTDDLPVNLSHKYRGRSIITKILPLPSRKRKLMMKNGRKETNDTEFISREIRADC